MRSSSLEPFPIRKLGARSSPLSRVQVAEAIQEFSLEPEELIWVETTGDLDQRTSLRDLEKSDFFTRELDQMLLRGEIDLAVHSAKDLPDPLPKGLKILALSKGVDPRDALVLRPNETLRPGSIIATSSARREENVRKLQSELIFKDLRGTIHARLALLDKGEADGVVVAEAALIRLQLTHLNRIYLEGETAEGQGKLALVVRE